MRTWIALSLVAVAATAYCMSQTAGAAGNGTDQLGPYAGGSPDGGSAGNEWADDTYNLSFSIHDNGDGTFEVKTNYKDGSFVTRAGASPGAAETKSKHGSTIVAGVKGSMQGWVKETVTSAVYVPTATGFTTRSGAIAAFFPGGTQSNFSWNFEYDSSNKSLTCRHWTDKSDNDGNDQMIGDISND